MPLTTQEVAQKLGTTREVAYQLVSFMEDMGLIAVAGSRPAPSGKGKPSKEYTFPPDCADKLKALLAKLT